MDKWKRGRSGVLVNDDAIGYENAKKRAALRAKKKEDVDRLMERVERLEHQVKGMELTIKSLVEMCHTLTEAIKSM